MPTLLDLQEQDSPSPSQLSAHSVPGQPDPTRILNYLQKYPPDKRGKELDPDSRTWKVYADEHESYDYDTVKRFRENIDALLVFAALFSSIVTGFVVPAAERLEPDNAQISTSILFEATQLLRANGNATLIAATPPSKLRPDSATHSQADVCIAWMFFVSLALSLATALVSILAKQWLQAFTAHVPGDAKRRSLIRQFRFAGIQRWKFAEIVSLLPLLLHISLLLFLVGLCIYVERYHWSILTMVGFVGMAAVVFYIITAALPTVYLDCPYRIPIVFIPAPAFMLAAKKLRFYVVNLWPSTKLLCKSLFVSSGNSRTAAPLPSTAHQQTSRRSIAHSSINNQEDHGQGASISHTAPSTPHSRVSQALLTVSSLFAREHRHVLKNTRFLEFSSLEWLYTQTTNTSVQRIVLHALARALEKHVCCLPNEIERTAALPSLPLEDMHTFAKAIIDGISGPERIAHDIPQLLDFHIHCSHALHGVDHEIKFPESRWPHLIDSPHLQSFTERHLLPLDVKFTAFGCTGYPLHIACYIERWDFVEKHLKDFPPSQWTDRDSDRCLPLARAATSNKISFELWKGIVTTTENSSVWEPALELPLNRDGDTALELLCAHGADLVKITSISKFIHDDLWNIRGEYGQTPLHHLCSNTRNSSQRLEIAKYFLSQGADLGIVNCDGFTPLHLACRVLHPAEFIKVLCSHLQVVGKGRDILNKCDDHGCAALHHGVFFGSLHSQSVRALISAGADPNIADSDNDLALHSACIGAQRFSRLDREPIGILLDHTNDINLRNKQGETPLDGLMKREGYSKSWQDTYDLMRGKGAKHADELEAPQEAGQTELEAD